MLQHKDYTDVAKFDDEANISHGEVLHLNDGITFQGTTVEEVRTAFVDSVEDYLAFCAERGEQAEKPFSGQFVMRIPPDLHRAVPGGRTVAKNKHQCVAFVTQAVREQRRRLRL